MIAHQAVGPYRNTISLIGSPNLDPSALLFVLLDPIFFLFYIQLITIQKQLLLKNMNREEIYGQY